MVRIIAEKDLTSRLTTSFPRPIQRSQALSCCYAQIGTLKGGYSDQGLFSITILVVSVIPRNT